MILNDKGHLMGGPTKLEKALRVNYFILYPKNRSISLYTMMIKDGMNHEEDGKA